MESVQNTPFYLNYGQHPLLPMQAQLLERKVPAVQQFTADMQALVGYAKQCMQAAQQRQKARADKSRREVNFTPGEMVMLNTKNLRARHVVMKPQSTLTTKFMPRWIGPFPVVKMIGEAAVKLQLPDGYRMHDVFHVSLIKPYRARNVAQPSSEPTEWVVDGDMVSPSWQVELILLHRGKGSRLEYLVKWAGLDAAHNSWERASDLLEYAELVDAYWASKAPQTNEKQNDMQLDAIMAVPALAIVSMDWSDLAY